MARKSYTRKSKSSNVSKKRTFSHSKKKSKRTRKIFTQKELATYVQTVLQRREGDSEE